MRYVISSLLALVSLVSVNCFSSAEKPSDKQSSKSVYEYSFKTIDGTSVNMNDFQGKKLLLVNVASECGFTPQYADLEKLNRTYKDKVVIIGFPANNFMGQEPGTNEEIADFCKSNYDVTFLLSEKISVTGDDVHPLYQWLTDKELNGWNDLAPQWNFFKYVIDEEGELVKVFPSTTEPLSGEITSLLN